MTAWVGELLDAYSLRARRIERLESADNLVFKAEATDGRRFVLRVHHGFDPIEEVRAHVEVEFGWLEHIRSTTGLRVPRPLRLRGGEPYGTVTVAGRARVFVLFEWIEGEPAGARLDPGTVRRMGSAIARLHESSRAFATPPGFCGLRWDVSRCFGPDSWVGRGTAGRELDPARFELVDRARQAVTSAMRELAPDPRYHGLIHSDTHPDNMLLADGEVAILDFSDCGWGHYLFDLGVMLFDLEAMLEQRGHAERLGALRESLLDGYREVAPLPASDPAQLEAFVALRCLVSLSWIARSPDPEERRNALRSRPGVPVLFRRLSSFVDAS